MIRSDLLAAKLQAAHNGDAGSGDFAAQLCETPRLLEALWFVQEMSRRPGGLDRFVDQIVETFPDRFQSEVIAQAGSPDKGGRYSLAQCLPLWQSDADRSLPFAFYNDENRDMPARSELEKLSYREWLSLFIGPETSVKTIQAGDIRGAALRLGLDRFNFPFLKQACLAAAKADLPRHLVDWCQQKGLVCDATWYYPAFLQTLFEFMDRHAVEARHELAETEVTKIVFRELEFAWSQKVPVPIIGQSRFGKSTSIAVWCGMRPGRARLVTVPASNRERDFFIAHADALGLVYTPGTSTPHLKEAVEFVLRYSGLFLLYDESHYLVPVSYHKSTPPARLNWVRSQVIDRGIGCAFFATPQNYRETLSAYVKKTGYCMEQWLGRMAPPVILPESLDSADVLAVARKHFPDVAEPYLKLISARALQSEGYLKNMELCVKRARFLAAERGQRALNSDTVMAAIDQMMPGIARTQVVQADGGGGPAGKGFATDQKGGRNRVAEVLQRGFKTGKSSARALQPARAEECELEVTAP